MSETIPAWETPRQDYTIDTTLYSSDFERIEKNILNLRNQFGPADITVGGPSAYTITIADIYAYEKYVSILVEMNQSNNGAFTVDLNGLGPVAVKNVLGNDPVAGEMPAGALVLLTHNGTNWQSFMPTKDFVTVEQGLYGIDAGVANAYLVALSGIVAYDTGLTFSVKILNTNTGTSTLSVNGLGIKDIKNVNGRELGGNQLKAGGIYGFVYDGIYMQLTGTDVLPPDPTEAITQSTSIEQVGGATYKELAVDGFAPEFEINGDSVVNLADNGVDYVNWSVATDVSVSVNGITFTNPTGNRITDSINLNFKPSTVYTLKYKIKDSTFSAIALFISTGGVSDASVSLEKSNGTYSVLFTSDVVITEDFMRFINVGTGSEVLTLEILAILEGDQTDRDITQELSNGINNANGVIKVVGKNQFDGELESGTYDGTTGVKVINLNWTRSKKLIKAYGELTLSADVGVYVYVYQYDANLNYLGASERKEGSGKELTFNTTGAYLAFAIEGIVIKAQLELGTTATDYVPYDSKEYAYDDIKSVPNGASDSINVKTGERVDEIKEYVLESGDITELSILANVDVVRILKETDWIEYGTDVIDLNESMLTNFSSGFAVNPPDQLINIGTIYSRNSTSYGYVVPKGTYTSLAEAQADLAGKATQYQLTTPIPSQIESEQFLLAKGGTIQDDSKVQSVKEYKVEQNLAGAVDSSNKAVVQIEKKFDGKTSDLADKTDVLNNSLLVPESEDITITAPVTVLPATVMTGQTKPKFKGLSVVNTITNGDFSDGLTDWNDYSGALALVNGNIENTGDGTSVYVQTYQRTKNTAVNGDVYFARVVAELDTAGADFIGLLTDGHSGGSGQYFTQILNPDINKKHILSGRVTLPNDFVGTMNLLIQFKYPDNVTAGGSLNTLYGHEGVHLINLTSLGLIGLSDERLDELCSSGYFDGLKNFDEVITPNNKNLFNPSNIVTNTLTGLTIENDRITFGGAGTNAGWFELDTRGIANLTLSGTLVGTDGEVRIRVTDEDFNFITNLVIGDTDKDILVLDRDKILFNFVRKSTETTWAGYIDNMMIEIGDTLTEYVRHEKSTQRISGSRVPNGTADTESVQNIKPTVTYNGSEAWQLTVGYPGQVVTMAVALTDIDGYGKNNEKVIISNLFTSISANTEFSVDAEGIAVSEQKALVLKINRDKLVTEDLAGFKTWLGENNLDVIYQLVTPQPRTDSEVLTVFKDGSINIPYAPYALILEEAPNNEAQVRLGNAEAIARVSNRLLKLDDAYVPFNIIKEAHTVLMADFMVAGGVDPFKFYVDIFDEDIKATDSVDVMFTFAYLSVATIAAFGATEAHDGFVRIISVNIPTTNVSCDLIIKRGV